MSARRRVLGMTVIGVLIAAGALLLLREPREGPQSLIGVVESSRSPRGQVAAPIFSPARSDSTSVGPCGSPGDSVLPAQATPDSDPVPEPKLAPQLNSVLVGRILDGFGAPVMNARVECRGSDDSAPLVAYADPAGEVRFDVPYDLEGILVLRAFPPPGSGLAQSEEIRRTFGSKASAEGRRLLGSSLELDLAQRPFEFRLARAGSLRLRVKTPGGAPASVMVYLRPDRGQSIRTQSGQVVLSELPAERHSITISDPRYLTEEHQIEIEPGAQTELEIQLRAGAVLRGHMTAVEGIATPSDGDYSVSLCSGGQEATSFVQRDGTFQLEGVPPGRAILTVSWDSRGLSERFPVDLRPLSEGESACEIVFGEQHSASLTLLASDAQGRPLRGWRVWLRYTDSTRGSTSDEEGRTLFPKLRPGDYTLQFGGPQSDEEETLSGIFHTQTIKVADGAQTLSLQLPDPSRLKGTVRDAAGRGFAGQLVAVIGDEEWQLQSDAQGNFEHGLLPPGVAEVFTRGEMGAARQCVSLVSGAEATLDLVLAAPARVQGRFRLAQGASDLGTPSLSFETNGVPTQAKVDTQGHFVAEGCFPGVYVVEFYSRDYRLENREEFTLLPGQTLNLDLRLSPRKVARD